MNTKRKGPPTSTIPTKRTRANAPSNPDHLKVTVGEHCQGSEGRTKGPDTRCKCDTNPQLQPRLATPLSKTPSTAPAVRTASSKPPASPTEDMEVILYLPTLCDTSRVIVTTPMLIPCIARVA